MWFGLVFGNKNKSLYLDILQGKPEIGYFQVHIGFDNLIYAKTMNIAGNIKVVMNCHS